MLHSKYIFFIFFTSAIFYIAEARSRFARQISNDDAPSSPLEPSSSQETQPQPREGQRELFKLSGPSLDFQRGSISPASLPKSFRSSQLSRGVHFDDYNEYGSRVAFPPSKNSEEKKLINVIPYKKTDVTTNQNTPRTSVTASTTTLVETETTTVAEESKSEDMTIAPAKLTSETGDEIDNYDDAPTNSKPKNLVH